MFKMGEWAIYESISRGLITLAAIFLGGCAISTPSGDSRFFLLSAPQLPMQEFVSPGTGLVAVGPVSFSDYLKRNTIVIQQSDFRYDIAKLDQWGGRLEDEFQLALLKNLVERRSDRYFVVYSGMLGGQAKLQLKADIYRFDVTPAGQARLEMVWAWVDRSNQFIAGGNFSGRRDAGITLEQNVAAMSELIKEFSLEAAKKLPK